MSMTDILTKWQSRRSNLYILCRTYVDAEDTYRACTDIGEEEIAASMDALIDYVLDKDKQEEMSLGTDFIGEDNESET